MLVLSPGCEESIVAGRFPGRDLYPQALKGAAFRLAPGKGQQAASPQALLRVLVVDDDQDSADSFAMLLKIWGHECRRVYDGPAALEMSFGFQPDVVLLDLAMPTINGFEVARKLRPPICRNGAMLIAVTGYVDAKHRLLCEQAGFDAFLAKPVKLEVLEDMLLVQKTRLAKLSITC